MISNIHAPNSPDGMHVAQQIMDALAGKTPAVATPPRGTAPAPRRIPQQGFFTVNQKHKAIAAYYATLTELQQQGIINESGLRRAFEQLLADIGREMGWTLIAEVQASKGNYPDATLRDANTLPRGYWEAKDTQDDLITEMHKKIAKGYPTDNTIFEDTQRAILMQNGKAVLDTALANPQDLADLLTMFFLYTEPAYEAFAKAVDEFKDRVPALAQGLMSKIRAERQDRGSDFAAKFLAFRQICQDSIANDITDDEIEEMLAQHLLTERLFRTIFQNQEFTQRNVIAREIETVIQALTARSFNRAEFLSGLDRFYLAIENAAQTVKDYADKQSFLNTVYERFFQGFAKYQADALGIVYTPQPIVDFMCASVEEVLQREFGRSLSEVGVQILDPCTGTGNFIVNLLRRMNPLTLEAKYKHDLFCNEIMLLPYYIASMNIEHAYYARTERYTTFEGICFADTLNLEGLQQTMFSERNMDRIERERAANLMVIIGNPPYNVGQQNENDNNKNRKYPTIDARIRETYARDSRATLKTQVYDPYVKFFRWATDRLQGRNGVVCFVSNNSFAHKFSFDGMRKHLAHDFTSIYHVNLRGDAHTSGELRRDEGGNVFNDQIRVGVGITLLVRNRTEANNEQQPAQIFYYDVGTRVTSEEKQQFLMKSQSIAGVQWQELEPDEETNQWLTEGMRPEFATYLPMGTKAGKAATALEAQTIFKTYSGGIKSNRDDWVYDFDRDILIDKIKRMIETYNTEVDRWKRHINTSQSIDSFVIADESRIKWSGDLKIQLARGTYATYNERYIRSALYRPFTKNYYYFDPLLNNSIYLQPYFFPAPASEAENAVIVVSDVGYRATYSTLMSNCIPDLHLIAGVDAYQSFPFYVYNSDGTNRQENITDWALGQFQATYGASVTKRDIFHYIYAILHHPMYRETYAENLKRELPRIPLVNDLAAFTAMAAAGAILAETHITYEQSQEYPLKPRVTKEPISWRVEKMRLSPDKTAILYNDTLTLEGVPLDCYTYRLGNRSALEWVIDQYQVSHDKRSAITTDPNRSEDPQYIAHLIGKVITVSRETSRIVAELPALAIPKAK